MRIAIMGKGAMGRVLADVAEERGYEIAGVVEPLDDETLDDLGGADVVIDFSNPANLDMIIEYCRRNSVPAVIATTGYDADQEMKIRELATDVPVVFSANFSLGINIMKRLIAQVTPILEQTFDIEIIEKHHNKKLDAPSGTAKMLLEAADPEDNYEHIYGREGNRKRAKEIGIHAIRGGTIAGEHSVIYAGTDEILEIKHTAASKKIFASGALKAAEFTQSRPAGFHTMEDVLFG